MKNTNPQEIVRSVSCDIFEKPEIARGIMAEAYGKMSDERIVNLFYRVSREVEDCIKAPTTKKTTT